MARTGLLEHIPPVFLAPLPEWARPTNPVLRYVLTGDRRRNAWLRRMVQLVMAGTIAGLLAISRWRYLDDQPLLLAGSAGSALYSVLYFPLLALQGAASLAFFAVTSNRVGQERRRGTWESLRITSHGAEMVVRAQWAATFYQFRWLLVILVIPRIVLAGSMLVDVTDYQGFHLDLYVTGIRPGVSLEVAIMLLAALMTAALMQAIIWPGFAAALGLLIAVRFSSPGTLLLVRILAVTLLIGGMVVSVELGQTVLDPDPAGSGIQPDRVPDDWTRLLLLGTLGDHSLRFMDLRTFLQTWTDVDYGVLLGGAILAVVVVEVLLTNGLLVWAGRRAARPDLE